MINNNILVSTPIAVIDTLLNIAMECRVWPSILRLHETVLYRVVMYILDMPDKFGVVSKWILCGIDAHRYKGYWVSRCSTYIWPLC